MERSGADECTGTGSGGFKGAFALPCEKKTVEALKAAQKPYSIHICGDTTGIIRDMGTAGVNILEIDWKISMEYARSMVPETTV